VTFEAPQSRNRGFSLPAATQPSTRCRHRHADPEADPTAAILLRIDPPRSGSGDPPPLAALLTLRQAALRSGA
jgi:hypothetical protein